MKFNYLKSSHNNKAFALLFFGMILSGSALATQTTYLSTPDSVGTEIINGEVYIIHKIAKNDTYYQLGRRYNVQVKDVMEINNKKNLRLGDTIKVPTGRRATAPTTIITATPAQTPAVKSANRNPEIRPEDIFTEYKVGKSETLYSISQKFDTNVADLKRVNNLISDRLREGTILKIPNSNIPQPESEHLATVKLQIPLAQPQIAPPTIDVSDFEANKYGIHEQKEKGVGVWMDNLESDGKSNLALHRSAPVGTILKITNPITKNVTYAKVVGKFAENTETQDAIVVLSKSAATYIGVHDRRFLVEITYGVPLNF